MLLEHASKTVPRPADNLLVKRFGRFVAIQGTGYERWGDSRPNERSNPAATKLSGSIATNEIYMNRQIKFQNVRIPCEISVSARGSLNFDLAIREFYDEMGKRLNQYYLVVTVTHPRFSRNTSDF